MAAVQLVVASQTFLGPPVPPREASQKRLERPAPMLCVAEGATQTMKLPSHLEEPETWLLMLVAPETYWQLFLAETANY